MQIPGYRVIRKINQGGMSTVYLAIQISVGRVVALKVMSPTLNGDPAFSERFQREANIVGQLSHPNIVAIYDIGRHDNLNYIAMDYLPGGSVHDRMMKGVSAAETVRTIRDIAIALDHAHDKGYVHRDIKPENILFRADHSAVLTDFGVAKSVSGVSRATTVGQVVGTPHYMSPEQTRGKPMDGRSDLYSLGVVFYEMLTGSVPFQGDEAVAIAIKHISAPVPRLPKHYEAYQKILDKMLAKDPDQRFQRGREVAEALDLLENPANSLQGAHPTEVSTLALFKALIAATVNAIRWRLRHTTQLRWSPAQGFYHSSPTQLLNALAVTDGDRSTLAMTRLQDVSEVQVLLSPRQRRRLVLVLAGVIMAAATAGYIVYEGLIPSHNEILDTTATGTSASSASSEISGLADANIGSKINGKGDNGQSNSDLAVAAGSPTPDEPAQAASTSSVMAQATSPDAFSIPLSQTPGEGDTTNSAVPLMLATLDPPETEPTYALTVEANPPEAQVRILNIGPRYTHGIELKPGRYHIEVSHPGYITHTTWVTMTDMPLLTSISLQKTPALPRSFSSDLPDGKSGPAMVTIDPGRFTMGSTHANASGPVHTVVIAQRFAISQHEITFEDYDLFAKATDRALPGDNRWGRGNRPVINVSWEDALAYTRWLSAATGRTYRLPSESEWEYVARAGSKSRHWWGENPADAVGKANCRRGCNSRYSGLFGSKTAPVGSYAANDFSIYDTAGNVSEWVQDCYVDTYSLKPKNGRPFEVIGCPTRVVRGGSAKSNLEQITLDARDHYPADVFDAHIGFRVVMELD